MLGKKGDIMMTNVGVQDAGISNRKEKKGKLDESRKIKVSYREELLREAKEAVGDRKVLGFVTGIGLQKLTQTIVMTESGVVFFDSLLFGHKKNEIPYSQIVCAEFQLQNGAPEFLIHTRHGITKLVLSGSRKKTNEAALKLFQVLKNKLSELAGVVIPEAHSTWLKKETWFFYTPPQFTVMAA
jgi:hypothetical protein